MSDSKTIVDQLWLEVKAHPHVARASSFESVLGGAEEVVASVAEAGDDVRLVVEPLVDRRRDDVGHEPRGVEEARHPLG